MATRKGMMLCRRTKEIDRKLARKVLMLDSAFKVLRHLTQEYIDEVLGALANELDDIYGMRITTKNTFIHIENDAPAIRRRSPSAPPSWPGCGLSHVADEGAGSIAPCLVTPTSPQPELFDIYPDDEGASFASGIDFGRIDLAFAGLHSALQDADVYNVNVPNDDPCDLDDGQYISADVNFSCELAMMR